MKQILTWAFIGAAILGFLAHKWFYPFGRRTCGTSCVVSALSVYAADHDGWFPRGGSDPLQSLAALCPDYAHPAMLAGLSGAPKTLKRKISNQEILEDKDSSWVYNEGLRSDDAADLVLIWEKKAGIGTDGRRMPDPNGHVVGLVDGSFRYVPGVEWANLLRDQASRRERLFLHRE